MSEGVEVKRRLTSVMVLPVDSQNEVHKSVLVSKKKKFFKIK